MKKFLGLFVAALMLTATASFAQKVDADGIKGKLAKVDADSQHAKKGTKASTWLSRGEAYLDALRTPTQTLYLGADLATIGLLTGQPNMKASGTTMLGGRQFEVYKYPYFTAYIAEGKLAAWENKNAIISDEVAVKEIVASYDKAVSLDAGAQEKAKEGLQALVDYYKLQGNLALDLSKMKAGADYYATVAEIEANPIYGNVEPIILFYAGYMYTIDGNTDVASFAKGEEILNKAVEAGYDAVEDANADMVDSERGNIYYYLFHCAYGLSKQDSSKLEDAKDYLNAGITKYPANEKIFEGLLQLYTSEDGVGDPKELLSTIEKNIAADPNNVKTWFGRGRIYFALNDYDECIVSFEKVVELEPEMFDGHYYLGLFHMLKGDAFLQTINKTTYTDQATYDLDAKKLTSLYMDAIPCFEKAHELKPEDETTLDYLKQLCFRLRDEPGVMDKYNKYNELYKALQ